jgi:hypothetical protein
MRRGVEGILKLAVAGGEGPCVDIMEISKPKPAEPEPIGLV